MQADRKKGVSALATVLTALSVFGILTASVGQLAMERLRGTSRSNLQLRAKYATSYGLERVLSYLDTHIQYDNNGNVLQITPVDVTDFQNQHTNVTLTHDTETRYSARLHANLIGPGVLIAPDGTQVAPGQIYIEMVGQVGETAGRVNTRHSGAMGHIGIQEYPYAVLADGPITMVNSTVDTYASRLTMNHGPLPPEYTYLNPVVAPQFAGVGRLASNARIRAFNFSSNTQINGTLAYGAGADPVAALNITGGSNPTTATPLAQPIFLTKYKPPVSPASVNTVHTVTGPGSQLIWTPGTHYRNLTVSNGAEVVLRATTPGTNTFYVSESLLLNNNARLRVEPFGTPGTDEHRDCRIKLYIGDQLQVVNSEINPSAAAPNLPDRTFSYSLNIFGVGRGGPLGHSTFTFNNSRVYALLAGSRLNIEASNQSHVYGAIKARKVTFTDSRMHYDASVNHTQVRSTLWGLVSWTLQGVSDYAGADLFIDLGAGDAAAAVAGAGAITDAAVGSPDAASPAGAATGDAVGDAAAVPHAAATGDAAADAATPTDAAANADAAATDAAATDAAATDAAATDAAATDAATTDAAATDAVGDAATDAAATGDAAYDAAATDAVATGDAVYDAVGCPGPNTHCP